MKTWKTEGSKVAASRLGEATSAVFAVVHAASLAEAWYILKAFPGYEIMAKYDLKPIVDFEDYYSIELAKETRKMELQEEKQL